MRICIHLVSALAREGTGSAPAVVALHMNGLEREAPLVWRCLVNDLRVLFHLEQLLIRLRRQQPASMGWWLVLIEHGVLCLQLLLGCCRPEEIRTGRVRQVFRSLGLH